MPTLGEHIREERLANGLSLGQLASKLGLTAAVVRSWERDQVTPGRPYLDSLAELLDTDIDGLIELVPPPDPDAAEPVAPDLPTEPDLPDTPELETISELETSPEATPVTEAVVETEVEPEAGSDPEVMPEPKVVSESEPEAASELELEPEPAAAPVVTTDTSTGNVGDLETEQVSMAAVMDADAGEVTADTAGSRRGFLEYWRDPEQRLRYYLRWVATAAVMLVLAVVLVWAMGELLDAIGQVTDQFGTQEPDELQSLGLTPTL